MKTPKHIDFITAMKSHSNYVYISTNNTYLIKNNKCNMHHIIKS